MLFGTRVVNSICVDAHRFLEAACAYRSHAGEVLVFCHENHSLPNGEGGEALSASFPRRRKLFLRYPMGEGGNV